ncbi:unnamed protein product [Tetraodon nigroviridis]|uniref:(spotted green pufferfish) hypothetical protein n=1 Tax=Tetraodon nigroviridis TaxID=99883 RepID=Q4REU4_TETNG|nr:unnamed protein product [Tetraodon nigroviridis]
MVVVIKSRPRLLSALNARVSCSRIPPFYLSQLREPLLVRRKEKRNQNKWAPLKRQCINCLIE